jgi:predicted ATPase/class 3 adenylate cyclase
VVSDPTLPPALPTGTVTFLRTDVEDSMGLMRAIGHGWDAVNATHLGILRGAIDAHGGTCVRTEGDAIFAVFPEARAAVTAAVEAQRAIATHAWPAGAVPRVRMGLHTGEAYLSGDDYGGLEVNRAARVAATGHGGQIVMSDTTRSLVIDGLSDEVTIRDLGRHSLRGLGRPEAIHQLVVPGLRSEFPPLRTAGPARGNLPERMTSFIGREVELEDTSHLLESSRLVTLTGPGGIGKTSLAVEVARARAAEFDDGAWLVELDAITDPGQVRATIARTIGLFDGPERVAADALTAYLADRTILLVLDNFEHLMEAAGDVAGILRSAPSSRIMVTSRAPLRIGGEQEVPLEPLRTSAATDPSIVLFEERAHSVRPAFDPEPDLAAIQEICGLLDGLPLGIELAAARVALLPVTAIRDRLAAKLPLPGGGMRDVPDRQRTLDGAIGWSYNLLSPDRQRLLRDLSVFDGGFDMEQIEAVHGPGDVLEPMVDLVDQSLAARDPESEGIRFRLLRTIETFAYRELRAEGREDEVRTRHAAAFLNLAEGIGRQLPGPHQRRLTARLRRDHANLRGAMRWAIDAGDVETALRFVGALWRYWQLDGHLAEGADLAAETLGMPGAQAPTAARLAGVTGAGGIAYWQGRSDEAMGWYDEQVNLAKRLGDRAAEADGMYNAMYGRFAHRDIEGARAHLERARALYSELGDERGFARTEWTRGTITMNTGQVAEARSIFVEALRQSQANDDPWYEALALGSLSWCGFFEDDLPAAIEYFVRSLLVDQALGDVASMSIALEVGAYVAVEIGRPDVAAELLGAMETAMVTYGVRQPAGIAALMAPRAPRQRVEQALDASTMAGAMERGRRMSLDEVVELIIATTRAEGFGPSTDAG